MCRIIVWAKPDNGFPDPKMDSETFKRGMVVDILEDGQEAGREVDGSPWWRIVEVPGRRASEFGDLLGSDPDFASVVLVAKSTFPRMRVQVVDLDAIEATAGKLAPSDSIALAKADIQNATTQAVAVANPAVIGSDPAVIANGD